MTTALAVEELAFVFSDVTPVPQQDAPVCQIAYKADFVTAYDFMRAILKSDERSERALKLTALCLKLNPANYTIWHFRRLCLKEVGLTEDRVYQDLELASELGGSNPKNYQIAFHRRALLEELGLNLERAKRELSYIAMVLQEDGKNYHMWSSRQWIIRTVAAEELYQEEINFSNELIAQDCRNNSAWNQRWFAVHRGTRDPVTEEVARKEAEYAIEVAQVDPYNESPWRYLIGIIKEHQSLVDDYEKQATEVKSVLRDAERDPEACANLNSARIDLLEMKGSMPALDEAMELCTTMASEHDVIRRKYWEFRANEIQKKM